MHVGIIELMEVGHIVLAETMCKIFCSDPHNKVSFFTNKDHGDSLNFLSEQYLNLSIIIKPTGRKRRIFCFRSDRCNLTGFISLH